MFMKYNNKVETDREDEEKKMSPLKDADDVCVEFSVERETLVVRRALNVHVKVDDLKGQRENIFHVRCHVQNKIFSVIINCGSYTNVDSAELVKKLSLHYQTSHTL